MHYLKCKNYLKSAAIIACLFVVTTAATPFTFFKTDFSGSWTLNADKSEFGNTPQYAAVKKFDIKQENDSVYISRVTVNANQEETTSQETLSLDGTPSVKVLDNKRTKKSTVTWSEDGKTMTTVSSYSFPEKPEEIEYTLTQTWSLDNNKKELMVDLTSPAYTIKAVYDKQ